MVLLAGLPSLYCYWCSVVVCGKVESRMWSLGSLFSVVVLGVVMLYLKFIMDL